MCCLWELGKPGGVGAVYLYTRCLALSERVGFESLPGPATHCRGRNFIFYDQQRCAIERCRDDLLVGPTHNSLHGVGWLKGAVGTQRISIEAPFLYTDERGERERESKTLYTGERVCIGVCLSIFLSLFSSDCVLGGRRPLDSPLMFHWDSPLLTH